MSELKKHIYDEKNGLHYTLVDDYYIPDIRLGNEEHHSIGHWGRMHMEYLKEYRPVVYQGLLLSGKLWTYLADLNEQAEERLECVIRQMKDTESVTEPYTRWRERSGNIIKVPSYSISLKYFLL